MLVYFKLYVAGYHRMNSNPEQVRQGPERTEAGQEKVSSGDEGRDSEQSPGHEIRPRHGRGGGETHAQGHSRAW